MLSRNRYVIGLVLLVGMVCLLAQQAVVSVAQSTNQPPPTNTKRPTYTPVPPTDAPTDRPTVTPVPSDTPTSTFTLTPSRTLTFTRTPTLTRTPTFTRTPTPTRTPTSTFTPVPTLVILGTYETPVRTAVTAIPPAAPTPVPSGDDVVTVLLLGSDTITPGAAARTDVIIVVSIDRTAGSVSMLHIPRDMLVYIPNSEKGMDKINTVVNYGNQRYGPGGGAQLIKQTLLYNYGLKIDFYARVDFVNFQEIIKELGGLQISVDCAVEGNKLKSPDMDITKPENYEPYTINIGVHKLDPYTALWYVRARGSSSDLDRGRRQIEVLRAIWRQAKSAGLLAQVTGLWPQVQKIVETDMTLTDIVGLVPVALSLDPASVQQVVLTQNVHFTQWYTSDVGSFTWLPVPAAWQTAVQNFVLPPSRSRLGGENPTVDVGAALPLKGYDQTAADRLSWEGYNVRLLKTESVVNRAETVIYDYTGGAKPNSLEAMRKALRVSPGNVISQPDPNATADFRVEMGRDYGTSCFYGLQN